MEVRVRIGSLFRLGPLRGSSLLHINCALAGERLGGGGGEWQAVDQLFLEIGEAFVTYKLLFRGKADEVGSLSLVAKKLRVVGGRELNKTGKVVFRVKVEKGLESGKASEVESRGRLDVLGLGGSLTLKYELLLLGAWAQGWQAR